MAEYQFVSTWRIQAPIERVWEEIFHTERWPSWWKYVAGVEELRRALPVGSASVSTWCFDSAAVLARLLRRACDPRPAAVGAGGRGHRGAGRHPP